MCADINIAATWRNPESILRFSVTLNTYTHVKYEDAKEDLAKVNLL